MKRVIRFLAALIAFILVVVAGYVAYVFIDYYRLPDMQTLEVTGTGKDARVGEVYTITSYNIGFGAYSADFGFFMDGGENARGRSRDEVHGNVSAAIDVTRDIDADIMLFQEVDVRGHRSHDVNEEEMLRTGFPDKCFVFAQNYDVPYLFYPVTEPIGSAVAGMATASDFNVTSAVRRSLPIDEGFMKLFDLDRCYSVCRVPVEGGGELVIYNVHLSAYTKDGSIVREQVQMLAADMAAEYAAGNYIVCGGDFNRDLPGNSAEIFGVDGDFNWALPFDSSLLPEGVKLIVPLNEERPVPSCRNADGPYAPGKSFVITVDGFIVSDNVKVHSCDVVDTGFMHSDHNPVQMDFELLGK